MNTYLFYFIPPRNIIELFDIRENFLHCTFAYFKSSLNNENQIKKLVFDFNEMNEPFLVRGESFEVFDEKTSVLKLESQRLVESHQNVIKNISRIDKSILKNSYFGIHYQSHISFRFSKPLAAIDQYFELNNLFCMRMNNQQKITIF